MPANRTRFILLTAISLIIPAASLAEPPRGSITIDRIAEIRYPTAPAWSPDGTTIAFLWDAAGKQDLFTVKPGEQPVALTNFPVNRDLLQSDIGEWTWLSADTILFMKDGQLFSVSLQERRPARVPGIDADGGFALTRDRKQIVFVRQGQLMLGAVSDAAPTRITRLAEPLRASSPMFSRDGRFVSFVASRSSTEFEPLPFNGTRLRSVRTISADRRLGIVAAHGGEPIWISTTGDTNAIEWTADGSLVYEEFSADRKTRAIKAVSTDGAVRTIWSDHDPAWWSPTRGPQTLVSPDGEMVAFFSDKTGWTHLYVAAARARATMKTRALTVGPFTTGYPAWSPDSRRIAYGHGVPGNQMVRMISVVNVDGTGTAALVATPGVQIAPMFAPDGRRVLYQRAGVEHSLDLYMTELQKPGWTVRLTDSMPSGLDAGDLTTPLAVDFPSRVDGKPVPATLMKSRNLDPTQKHPAIVWIHGSGSDQNFVGWHPGLYRMYYSMHQYLAQQGYVILTPDYRGSSGYDRDWATGNYLDLGGNDYLDVASGADYLKTLSYVDPDRIGVWGLSYGGFMTLQAMTVTPTLFRCAIDVAGVTDWGPRGGAWTIARLGTPSENPEAYYRSAPVKHISKLERPLLILHGTADTNVAFHDSLSLIDALVKLGKPFETAIYPGEPHFFRRAHVLRDAWRRAEEFFDRYLKVGSGTD